MIPNAFLSFKLHILWNHTPPFLQFYPENTFINNLIPNYSRECLCYLSKLKLQTPTLFNTNFNVNKDFRLCFGAHNTIKFISHIYKAFPVVQDADFMKFPDLKMTDFFVHHDIYLVFWVEWLVEKQWINLAWALVSSLELNSQSDENANFLFNVTLFQGPFFYQKPVLCHENDKSLLLSFECILAANENVSGISNDPPYSIPNNSSESIRVFDDELCFSFASCNISLPPLLPQNSQIQKSPLVRDPPENSTFCTLQSKKIFLPSRSTGTLNSQLLSSNHSGISTSVQDNEPLLSKKIPEIIKRKPSVLYAFSDHETFFHSDAPSHIHSIHSQSMLEESSTVRVSDTFQTISSRPDSAWSGHSLSRTFSATSGSTLHSISYPIAPVSENKTATSWETLQIEKLAKLPFVFPLPETTLLKHSEVMDMHLEGRDPFLIHHLSIHFIGYTAMTERSIRSLKFVFNFYTQSTTETPDLYLHDIEEDLPSLFQVQGQTYYGYVSKWTIDLANNFPYTFATSHCHFLEYLRSKALEIHIWNAETLFPLGVAKIPLQHLLRQGEQTSSVLLSAPILNIEKNITHGTLYYALTNTGELHPTYRSWRDVLHCKHSIQEVDDYHALLLRSHDQPLYMTSEPLDLDLVLHFPNVHPVAQRAKLLARVAQEQGKQEQALPSLIVEHIHQQRTSVYSTEVRFGSDHVFEFNVNLPSSRKSKFHLVVNHSDVTLLTSADEWDYYSIDSATFQNRFQKETFGYSFLLGPESKSCTLPLLFHSRTYTPILKVQVHIQDFHDSSIRYCSLEATFHIQLPPVQSTLTYFVGLNTPFSTTFTLDSQVLSMQSSDPEVQAELLGPNIGSLKFSLHSISEPMVKKKGYLICYSVTSLHFCIQWVLYGYPLVTCKSTFFSSTELKLKVPRSPLIASCYPSSFVTEFRTNEFNELEVKYDAKSIDKKEDQGVVHCLDPLTKNVLCGWILKFHIVPPKVSKSFKVQLPANSPVPKRIKFRNTQSESYQFYVSCTHPNFLHIREKQFRLNPYQEIYIHLTLLPAPLDYMIDVYINIREENGEQDEWFSIQILSNRS
ncbi:hypothetical protein HMI56_007285 [Coelomomyces lativittatus]|nr:hypothetical protein HMI56_007285 [Coelomomyces lativittatus]